LRIFKSIAGWLASDDALLTDCASPTSRTSPLFRRNSRPCLFPQKALNNQIRYFVSNTLPTSPPTLSDYIFENKTPKYPDFTAFQPAKLTYLDTPDSIQITHFSSAIFTIIATSPRPTAPPPRRPLHTLPVNLFSLADVVSLSIWFVVSSIVKAIALIFSSKGAQQLTPYFVSITLPTSPPTLTDYILKHKTPHYPHFTAFQSAKLTSLDTPDSIQITHFLNANFPLNATSPRPSIVEFI
jgi:hypothetical protein